MANHGKHPNLRHRRKDSGATGEGTPSLLKSMHYNPAKGEASLKDQGCALSSTCDGYLLVGLQKRSVITRLDVGPFLVAYAILIFSDFYLKEERLRATWISSFTMVAFPLVLSLHFALFLLQQWRVKLRARVGFQRVKNSLRDSNIWTHCLVEAPHVDKHHASHDEGIVGVTTRGASYDSTNEDGILMVVNFQDIIFRCKISTDRLSQDDDDDSLLWSKSGGDNTPPSVPVGFHRLRYPIDQPLSFYKQWRGHSSMKELLKAQQTYGTNTTNIELPPFVDLLQEQVLAPFFLFQVLCVLLWSLDEYWYYAMFTFFALLMFESTMAYNRLKSLERLRSHTIHTNKLVWAYRPSYPPGRNGWMQISVAELVPGDLISCKQITISAASDRPRDQTSASNLAQKQQQLNRVPADILVLNGDAVVDEALLTGESVPQLKVPLAVDGNIASGQTRLDLQEQKQSVLFGGTTLMVGQTGNSSLSNLPNPPDQGLVGMVLRTGFETAQGALLRTMAHTQKSVDGVHTRDTYVFIVILLLCAVASAAVVFEEGWNDPTRNKFRLCLHLIIIVTSVVPPELPMELSLAVTNSLADLMKRKIFCTEAFRIPLAGQIDVCCFDKTGTLTSDEIHLTGLSLAVDGDGSMKEIVFADHQPVAPLPWTSQRIMVACHSLSSTPSSSLKKSDEHAIIGDPLEKAVLEKTGYRVVKNDAMQKYIESDGPDSILILRRFGFSSKLKRMTTLIRESGNSKTWVLTKGAPETVKDLLRPSAVPSNYDTVSMSHMAKGQRVLAMAFRELSPKEAKVSVKEIDRETVESDLIFAGFLLFRCPIKHDSTAVIGELQQSGNKVVMITGDAMLTAVEVSRQVGLISQRENAAPIALQLKHIPSGSSCNGKNDFLGDFKFVPFSEVLDYDSAEELTLDPSRIDVLRRRAKSGKVALCVSGDVLQKLVLRVVEESKSKSALKRQPTDEKQLLLHPEAQALLKDIVPLVQVYARHAPRQKEAIIAAFNLGGFKTLMCGDGTNDVGALRRAHVGISLISAPEVEAKQRSAVHNIARVKKQKKDSKKKRTKGVSASQPKSTLERSLRQLQEAQDELDQIDLGDASIASPFTSRVASISCCRDVLKQGRCTLVTMLQIYKILGVNCLVNATILSKLFLHGVKQGDRQMTALGLIVAALFFFVTRGKPLPNLSAVRPPTSVLCLQAILSIACQFSIHFSAMLIATEVALSFNDPFDPSLIPDGPFNPNTLNTCTFLVSVLATVNTFAVNYRGEPFVEPLRKNKMLWRSLQSSYFVLVACTFEIFPPLNDVLQLAEFPNATSELREWTQLQGPHSRVMIALTDLVRMIGFPVFLFGLMVLDTFFAFSSEMLVLKVFENTR